VVATADLLRACRTAQTFARDGADITYLNVEMAEGGAGMLAVSARSPETGDGVTVLDARVEGNPIRIAFNVRYLMDFLTAVEVPQVAIEMTAPDRQGVFRAVGLEEDWAYVVMPFHIQEDSGRGEEG
jgi:DNA polymerase-3 subunit beta